MEALITACLHTPIGSFIVQTVVTTLTVHFVENLGEEFFLDEFVCTFQILVLTLELESIEKAYGYVAYGAGLFFLSWLTIKTLRPRRQIKANPSGTMNDYGSGKLLPLTPGTLVLRLACQIFGAILGYSYVSRVWSSGLLSDHVLTSSMIKQPCLSEMKATLVTAVFVEGAITFFSQLIHYKEHDLDPWFCSAIGVMCTFACAPFTGGHHNPALAVALQYGCVGHTNLEFAAVHILAPLTVSYFIGKYGETLWRSDILRRLL